MADIAFNNETKFDYFFQIGDDVILETPGWTSHFISRLKEHHNVGIVGPCHVNNYLGRLNSGSKFVIENAFVSRKHLEIFGYFFHPSIKNWYCDDWITRIYDDIFCEIQVSYTCRNSIMGSRYIVDNCKHLSQKCIEESKLILHKRRIFSYCVFGNEKKYCLGMVKNLEQIKVLFPGYNVWIYLGNDVPQEYIDIYKSFENVTLLFHDFTGRRITAYRYLVLDKEYDSIIVRDSDSRFGERDIWCISNFMKSKYRISTIRDHPWQGRPLMAGQTMFKYISFPNITEQNKLFSSSLKDKDRYQNDQDFIEQVIFNKFKHETISYAEFYNFGEIATMKIPLPRKSPEDFCGNVYSFDEDNNEYTEFTVDGKK